MKVESGRNVGAAAASKRAGASASGVFAPADPEAAPQVAAASSLGGVAALESLLALQAEEPPAQRRARQTKRGQAALDALEQLEAGLLAGRAPAALRAELERLQRTAQTTGEPGLDGVLREIDTRLAVELAKLERLAI
jgi:hypothetical protein